MKVIASIKKITLSTRWIVLWNLQFLLIKIKNLIPRKVSVLNICSSDNVLILAPHADDEWIGCYSLLNLKQNNITCCYLNLYGNDYSIDNIKTRTKEIKESSQYWGFNLEIIDNCDVDKVKECLQNRSLCFIPSPYDWHPEHRKVFCVFFNAYCHLSDAEKESLQVYYYAVSVPHSNKEELNYLPLSKKEVELKWQDFKRIYPSQSFMPSVRYKLQLRLVPKFIGYAAQLYICANNKRLNDDYNIINRSDIIKELNSSSHDISNILKSRSIVNRIIYKDVK